MTRMGTVHCKAEGRHDVNRITAFANVCFAWAATLLVATIVVAATSHAQSPVERRDNPPLATPNVAGPAVEAVAPFAATPMVVVDEMLKLAGVGPNDFVVDLGSGDGRLVLTAVTKFGARGGFGVDIDASLVDYSNRKAHEAGIYERARFYVRDLFVTDIHEATVVTVYLLPIAMNRLQAKLLAELPPGTRVVSHDYPFRSWAADRVVALDVPEKSDYTGRRSTSIYLYTVPARAPRQSP
jgi:SAM-dependent methyltransferase